MLGKEDKEGEEEEGECGFFIWLVEERGLEDGGIRLSYGNGRE